MFGNDLDGCSDGLCTLAFIQGSIAPISVASSYQKHLGGGGLKASDFSSECSCNLIPAVQHSLTVLLFPGVFFHLWSCFGLTGLRNVDAQAPAAAAAAADAAAAAPTAAAASSLGSGALGRCLVEHQKLNK